MKRFGKRFSPAAGFAAPEGGVAERRGRLYDWVCIVLMAASPLLGPVIFGAVLLSGYSALMFALFIGCFLVFLRPIWFPAARPLCFPPGSLLWILFIIYALIRIPYSASPYEARVETLKLFSYLAAYVAWVKLLASRGSWRVLLALALLVGSFICLYGFVQQTRDPIMVWNVVGVYGRRLSGTYICPNHVAALLSILSCMAVAIILSPGTGAVLRIFAVYGLLTYLPAIYLTQSRAGWLGLAAGLTVTLLLIALRRSIRLFILLLVLIPLVLAAVGIGAYHLSPMVRDRYHEFVRPKPHDPEQDFDIYNVRLDFWQDTLRMIEDEPVWGFGAGSYRYVYPRYISKLFPRYLRYAHNDILHHTAEYGLVGLSLFTAFMISAAWVFLRSILRTRREKDAMITAGAIGGVAASLVHSLFDFNFQFYSNNHVMVLFVAIASTGLVSASNIKVWNPARPSLVYGFICLIFLAAVAFNLQLMISHYVVTAGEARAERLDIDGAERAFEFALRVDPGNRRAVNGLAELHITQAHWAWEPEYKAEHREIALKWALRSQELNPYDESGPYYESRVYALAGEHEKALELRREIVERVPNFAFYHKALADQLHRMGRLEEALEVYRRARSLDHEDRHDFRGSIRRLQQEIRAREAAGSP